MSPLQQVWTACWSGLVHSGWDSLRCAWWLHSWVKKTGPHRGHVFVAKELKGLAHLVRAASLGSKPPEGACCIRKDVVASFVRLAEQRPPDGFAFSRLSRALPLPTKGDVREALNKAIAMSKTAFPTSDDVCDNIRRFVAGSARPRFRKPSRMSFPSSNSSCYEWPATRGGIDGYLYAIGCACESGSSDYPEIAQIVERRLTRDDLKGYAGDSAGRYALRAAGIILRPLDGPPAADIRLAYRCAGFLALRRFKYREVLGPRSRMEALPSAGMKVRVIGVPDAITFIEADWIRRSCPMLPRAHWVVSDGPNGQPNELAFSGGRKFASVDLTSATDGLSHRAVRAVIEGLTRARCIRPADVELAESSLGLGPQTAWISEGSTWLAQRGSPMGTPLSFVVLSWINAWATSAFSKARIHGDDAVGAFFHQYEMDEYEHAIHSVGASVNGKKTFVSSSAWTMCEVASWPRERAKLRNAVFVPPPCPPPGLSAPVAAESRCGNRFLRRQERVMKTLFPWVARDPRLRLPVEVGGLGYTGRGLAVPRSVRERLGTLVSRGSNLAVAGSLTSKSAFREAGLYPRALVQEPSKPRSFNAARRLVAQDPLEDPSGVPVRLEDLKIFEAQLIEDQYRLLEGDKFKRKRNTGRPEKTKTKALFRPLIPARRAPPLTVRYGCGSLRRWASALRNTEVRVFEDVASEILGRTPDSAQA